MALLDKDYLQSLVKYDPEFQEICDRTGLFSGKFSKSELKQHLQKLLEATYSSFGPAPDDITETDLTYTTRDGAVLSSKLICPRTPSENGRPLFVLFHGSAFFSGNPGHETLLCRNLVRAIGAVCVVPTYRQPPQHVFPTAAHDAWDALKWAATPANTREWGADPSAGFVVGGSSFGANLAAVVTHMARDEGLSPPLTGHYLSMGILTVPAAVPDRYRPSYLAATQNKESPVLDASDVDRVVHEWYKADPEDRTLFSVLDYPQGHDGLSPVFVQAAGLDPLRDDMLLYERILSQEHGIKTRSRVYAGLPHAFHDLFPRLTTSIQFHRDQVEGLAWLVGREADMTRVVTELVPEDVLNTEPALTPRPVFY